MIVCFSLVVGYSAAAQITSAEDESQSLKWDTPDTAAEIVAPSPQSAIEVGADKATSNKSGIQKFSGNFLAIGAGVIISADKARRDLNTGLIEASGRVILISEDKIFLGDKIEYNTAEQIFKIENASLTSNDIELRDELLNKIFGRSYAEIQYEISRQVQIENLKFQKKELQEQFKGNFQKNQPNTEIIDQYITLLRREQRIKKYPSRSLAYLPPLKRQTVVDRRVLWENLKNTGLGSAQKTQRLGYFAIKADKIEKVSENFYKARDAEITPCKCEEGDDPDWQFSAERINAQMGGYADLYNPVLEISGIPIMYFPYMKIPLKDRRQSGFLLPVFGSNKSSGNIYSLPIFFAIAEDKDATLYLDLFERRGNRIGLEYRTQNKKYSGFTFKVSTMRDRKWLIQKSNREQLQEVYLDGLENAELGVTPASDGSSRQSLLSRLSSQQAWRDMIAGDDSVYDRCFETATSDADYIACQEQVKDDFKIPPNALRSEYSWQGLQILAPRLSLVTEGKIYSDHRYANDLRSPTTADESLFNQAPVDTLSKVQSAVHFDGSGFYLGFTNHFIDNLKSESQFFGYQMPLRIKMQTRNFYLLDLPIVRKPVHYNISHEMININEFNQKENQDFAGSGTWQKSQSQIIMPLFTHKGMVLNLVSNANNIAINHNNRTEYSNISYLETGVEFSLPFEGRMTRQSSSNTEDEKADQYILPSENRTLQDQMLHQQKVLKHKVRLNLGLYNIPDVIHRGEYYENILGDPTQSYMYSADSLQKSNVMTISLYQNWSNLIAGYQHRPGAYQGSSEDIRRQALWELSRRTDRNNSDVNDLVSGNAYVGESYTYAERATGGGVTLDLATAYDFSAAARREGLPDEVNKTSKLNDSWKPLTSTLTFSLLGTSFRQGSRYDLNRSYLETANIGATFPTFLTLTTSLYFEKANILSNDSSVLVNETLEARLHTSAIPHISPTVSWRQVDNENQAIRHETNVSINYIDPSGCWELNVERHEAITKQGRYPEYLVQLSVVFFGQRRKSSNLDFATRNFDRDNTVE